MKSSPRTIQFFLWLPTFSLRRKIYTFWNDIRLCWAQITQQKSKVCARVRVLCIQNYIFLYILCSLGRQLWYCTDWTVIFYDWWCYKVTLLTLVVDYSTWSKVSLSQWKSQWKYISSAEFDIPGLVVQRSVILTSGNLSESTFLLLNLIYQDWLFKGQLSYPVEISVKVHFFCWIWYSRTGCSKVSYLTQWKPPWKYISSAEFDIHQRSVILTNG
jgi:hypothetical protein